MAQWYWGHGWGGVSAVQPRCPQGQPCPEHWHAASPARGARLATLLLASDLHCWLGAGNEVFVKLIKTTEARRKGKLISHGNQLDLIQKNKQRVRSVSLAGCFSGKGITRRFPPKGMALCCCSLCNWGFRSGTKSHYHKISLSEKKVDIYEAQEGAAKQDESIGARAWAGGFPVPWGRALGGQRGAAGEEEEEEEEQWWQLPRQARTGVWADGESCNSTRRTQQGESQWPKCGNGGWGVGWGVDGKAALGVGDDGEAAGTAPRDTGHRGAGQRGDRGQESWRQQMTGFLIELPLLSLLSPPQLAALIIYSDSSGNISLQMGTKLPACC